MERTGERYDESRHDVRLVRIPVTLQGIDQGCVHIGSEGSLFPVFCGSHTIDRER